MGVHAKFSVHWTGSDFVKNLKPDALVEEYAKRLKDDYQKGLYAKRKKEKDVLPGASDCAHFADWRG
jgi:hypothetical protein